MNHTVLRKYLVLPVMFAAILAGTAADPDPRGLPPTLDSQGRFWVYRNGPGHPVMPFMPYGWMSDATNLLQLIQLDLQCRDHPNTVFRATGVPERDRCIRIKVTWRDASWASVAFISGRDKPPWWGDTEGGKYYNLAGLPRRRLVFYARGALGGETIKAQIGALGDKPYGDSLPQPIASEDIKLTQDWVRHEIELKDTPAPDLARICNGFGILAERASQPGSPVETQFYIDDVYFE
jgi:hypothetical protein